MQSYLAALQLWSGADATKGFGLGLLQPPKKDKVQDPAGILCVQHTVMSAQQQLEVWQWQMKCITGFG